MNALAEFRATPSRRHPSALCLHILSRRNIIHRAQHCHHRAATIPARWVQTTLVPPQRMREMGRLIPVIAALSHQPQDFATTTKRKHTAPLMRATTTLALPSSNSCHHLAAAAQNTGVGIGETSEDLRWKARTRRTRVNNARRYSSAKCMRVSTVNFAVSDFTIPWCVSLVNVNFFIKRRNFGKVIRCLCL
jgi:hypothetical protein